MSWLRRLMRTGQHRTGLSVAELARGGAFAPPPRRGTLYGSPVPTPGDVLNSIPDWRWRVPAQRRRPDARLGA